MAKTTVATITSDIKALVDYDITDTALDALILKGINLAIKRMKQWFLNEGMYDEIGAHDTFDTTANQEYVDIATEVIDFDEAIVLSERTNDSPITIISFKEYRESYPDPTANKSATPDVAAFFSNRLYLGPTPSGVITLYLDYVKLITKLTSGGTLPYEDKYDEAVIAIIIEYLVKWLDRGNRKMVLTAREDVAIAKHELFVGAAKNIGVSHQSQSRRAETPYFAPRKPV